ncbi:MBL fold metallo-hydrolase [Streptomyces sp. ET3-23]|uniref:MBL fold metallo-hydrolase n=1 Tax=Streptomyces sp. ET3-23 TaxID=2885643 RepID=UPI001D0FCE09|nr:MBL fold metallo-hydrolase [Streptomyces sp. ET3-23]MCC2275971.1 MBL fold metallo-hydrolase [Streptomyces sp. ET3-23]
MLHDGRGCFIFPGRPALPRFHPHRLEEFTMTTCLELTFVGHQTWHITDGDTVVLLDPILAPAFGASDLDFTIWPPRTVNTTAMPQPDAVILSHEHLDHFHLPSLNLLQRTVPVYTGTTTPQAVADAITALGFAVRRLDHTAPLTVGDIEITLFPAGARTLFWEQRVIQPVIRQTGTTGNDIFIGVDADVSDLYLEQVARDMLAPPRLAVVSNNAQTVPYGCLGADTNLLPGLDGPRHRRTGLEILNSLLIDYLRPLDGVRDVALCGNGFTAPRSPHGPFLYADHQALAEAANALQHLFRVHGPRPGDRLTVPRDGSEIAVSRAGWVTIDTEAEQRLLAEQSAFLDAPQQVDPSPIMPPLPEGEHTAARRAVAGELPRLARDLMATRMGALASGIHDYLSGPLGPNRAVLRLLDPPGNPGTVEMYVWNITGPAMVQVEATSREDAMAVYPFGIEIYYQDLLAVFTGRAQIWDVVGGSYQGWHIGEPLDSPVYALFAVYGEHQRPDLAARCYARSLAALGTSTAAGA